MTKDFRRIAISMFGFLLLASSLYAQEGMSQSRKLLSPDSLCHYPL